MVWMWFFIVSFQKKMWYYAGTLCVRMLPVLDRVLARVAELDPLLHTPSATFRAEFVTNFVRALGPLYRFHGLFVF
jgi:hypothetical protein